MVQLANLQALLTRRPAKSRYAVLLFRVGDPAAARGFVRDLLPRIAFGDSDVPVGRPLLNICVSWRAIAALVSGKPQLDADLGRRQFEPFFTDPLQAPDSLADQLGFTGPSAPSRWWSNFRAADIDLAIYAGFDDDAQSQSVVAELRTSAAAAGLVALTLPSFSDGVVAGYMPAGGRLHFGYRDGITSPDIDWDDSARPGAANLREFLLGYPTDDYPTTPYPPGPWQDFARDGSFACFTWIHQDVAAFEGFLAANAPALAPHLPGVDAKEWLAARLMGRWRDGTPLAQHPDAPATPPDARNDFGYADDPAGAKCPLGAHIRVAYGRDQSLSFANASRFPNGPPRLIRRGFSYGEPLTSEADDGRDRGLFGLFLCARINEQFYTVLRWMQQTDFSDVFDRSVPGRDGQDRLTGSRLPGGGNRTPDTRILATPTGASVAISLKPFIRYKGVVALFLPSATALRTLASV